MSFKKNGRASWTLRTNYRALHAFYNWMAEEEFVQMSPLQRIRPPRVDKVGKPFITREQLDWLLRFCPPNTFTGARTAAMLKLLWGTGIRLSELAQLKIADLEWDWGPKKQGRIKVFGKGRRERYVEFPKEAKKAVWRYLAHRDDDLPQLWLSEERLPLAKTGVSIAIVRTYQRAGLRVKDVCHIFRRTWARRKIEEGIPQKYIMLTGGWEDPDTMDKYVRAMDSEEALRAMQA